jgi:hypothetical protein
MSRSRVLYHLPTISLNGVPILVVPCKSVGTKARAKGVQIWSHRFGAFQHDPTEFFYCARPQFIFESTLPGRLVEGGSLLSTDKQRIKESVQIPLTT